MTGQQLLETIDDDLKHEPWTSERLRKIHAEHPEIGTSEQLEAACRRLDKFNAKNKE